MWMTKKKKKVQYRPQEPQHVHQGAEQEVRIQTDPSMTYVMWFVIRNTGNFVFSTTKIMKAIFF